MCDALREGSVEPGAERGEARAGIGNGGCRGLRGRAAGKAAWAAKRQAARNRAVRQSGEIRHDVQNSSDPALDRRLDRWMRD
jgi:hypothetical protein